MKKVIIATVAFIAGLASGVIATLAVVERNIDDPIYDACHRD